MKRRQLVLGGATGVLAGFAGCLNTTENDGSQDDDEPEDNDDDGDNSEPPGSTEVVREYLRTLYGGTAEEVNAFLHPDSDVPEFTEDQMEQYEDRTIQIDSVERLDRATGTAEAESAAGEEATAEVEATVTVDTGSRTISDTASYELRTVDGEWKIYSIGP